MKLEAGHGEGKLQNMPHHETRGGTWRKENTSVRYLDIIMKEVKQYSKQELRIIDKEKGCKKGQS